jgi:D-amino-acid dehydrogenase
MKVTVIGAGLIGISTAYFLRLRGHDVTVIEREKGPGLQTSFANGALVTPSMPEPWNAPGCWRVLLGSLGRSDAPLRLRMDAIPGLTGWGIQFLRNSSPGRYQESCLRNLRLALFSLNVLQDLRRQTGIEYDCTARGSLRLFRNEETLHDALRAADPLLAEGLRLRRLSRAETIALEPALAPIGAQLAGAIHYAADETGDAHRFCNVLAEHATQRGVNFSFGTSVSRLELGSGHIAAVQTDKGRLVTEQYVVAAGSYSTPLLRPLGLHVPVRPAKGYSVTFDGPRSALSIPIVDDGMHAVLVPVGNATRVAGTAEFAGFDLRLRPERIRNLTNLAQKILPHAGLDPATARPWCGLRPLSADGVPIIGPTPISNLWVNTGHGALGWTMAAGSGQLLAELLSRDTPSVDPEPYGLARFG